MSDTFTIAEVAKRLGTTQKAVRRLVAADEIISTKKGSTYSISSEALLAYLNNNDKSSTTVKISKQSASNRPPVKWVDILPW